MPTSSELVLGFGGVLAAEGKLSLPGVILAGTAGEVVGAYIAWFIGRTGGRAFVDRYGRYLLLTHRDLDRAEDWYDRHGRLGVFASRLIPVIRNFVALPAGVAEVPLVRFGLLTAAGSLIWCTAMALIGYEVGGSWRSVMHGFSYAGYLLAAIVILAVAVFIVHRYRAYKAATAPGAAEASRGRHFATESGSKSGGAGVSPVAGDGSPVGDASAVGEVSPTGEVSPRQQP